jgi:hypothetical protein
LLTDSIHSIVFVHGLFGHPKNTWTHNSILATSKKRSRNHDDEETSQEHPDRNLSNDKKELFRETYWPRDLLPKTLPRARILTWGYDVRIEKAFEPVSQVSILQHAEGLLSDLHGLRAASSSSLLPLVFVAHSLGGIIVKDALSLSRFESGHLIEISLATIGVVFMGTPHRGSRIASIGKIAFELSKVLLKSPNVQILRTLEVDSDVLLRIGRNFEQLLGEGKIKIQSFSEELKTKGTMIVDSVSSTLGHSMEARGTIHADHRNMTKFASENDTGFKRVSAVLRQWETEAKAQYQLEPCTDYQRCLESLYMSELKARISQVEDVFRDTYSWLFTDTVEFKNWLAGEIPSNVYWIQGKPASGKSTIMKYAMASDKTKQSLQRYSASKWITAGFFFHDRGSSIQKSIHGFLREVLFQMLQQEPSLFSVVADDFRNHSATVDGKIIWTITILEKLLISLTQKADTNLNLCLFVDALDEHDGNNRDFVAILKRLESTTENPFFRLRLCLAGRPDNVFKDELSNYPGFAIHHHTTGDIRAFTSGRLRSEIDQTLVEQNQMLDALAEDVVKKAQGVFLWVRLVVDELLDGLSDGYHLEELRNLLAGMPKELEELYFRALTRTKSYSQQMRERKKFETYVMFQITLYAEPLGLHEFIEATLFHVDGRKFIAPRLSEKQMIRRVNSSSHGLLEIADENVQFAHQTMKEFVLGARCNSLFHNAPDNRFNESGDLLMLRYLIGLLQSREHYDPWFFGSRLGDHGFGFDESSDDQTTSQMLRETFMGEEQQELFIPRIEELIREYYGWITGPTLEALCHGAHFEPSPQEMVLILYLDLGLYKSFIEEFALYRQQQTNISALLSLALATYGYDTSPSHVFDNKYIRILEVLVQAAAEEAISPLELWLVDFQKKNAIKASDEAWEEICSSWMYELTCRLSGR